MASGTPILSRPRLAILIAASLALFGGGAALLVAPDAGRLLVPALSAAIAALLLGGADLGRRLLSIAALRRDRAVAQDHVRRATAAAFAVGPDGTVLAQNDPCVAQIGHCRGHRILDDLARQHADPDLAWRQVLHALARSGRCRVELDGSGEWLVSRDADSRVQLWQGEAVPRPLATDAAGPAGNDDFARLPVSLLTLDATATILRVNESARDLLGGAKPGQSLTQFLDGLGREVSGWVSDICAGRTAGGSEVLHLKAGATDRFVQVSLTRGEGDTVTAVLSDASAMKTLEAQFVQSQKMQAIGQLAGGIAHDFNNLLTAITGHCDLLMLRHDKADPDYADLDQISQNANRAAALVRQLLAFSRKQTLKPQIMDLRDTLADLTHLLNRLVGERVVLTFDHDPKLQMIRADRRQLEQVIMNLVVNARDAMPKGGDITITTDNLLIEGATRIGQAKLPPGEYVRVQVRDQGCGIAAEELGKIFEPFYTTKRTGEGTGLGLSTAYGIVKQTGGYIFCDSVLGEGSTFSLYFPAHDKPATPEAEVKPAQGRLLARREADATVLLVEDEAPVRAFASRALKLQGFNVIEAASAEEALSLLADPALQVEVFVTDVVMPGMDGPSWVREALRNRPESRVIFMSGYADDIFAEGHTPIPNSAFLAKPFSLSDLTALVTRQLESGPGPRE